MTTSTFNQLAIAPLGAGDLIDRAVRLYRRHFFILIRIASPPVVVAAFGSVLYAMSIKELTSTSSAASLAVYAIFAFLGRTFATFGTETPSTNRSTSVSVAI